MKIAIIKPPIDIGMNFYRLEQEATKDDFIYTCGAIQLNTSKQNGIRYQMKYIIKMKDDSIAQLEEIGFKWRDIESTSSRKVDFRGCKTQVSRQNKIEKVGQEFKEVVADWDTKLTTKQAKVINKIAAFKIEQNNLKVLRNVLDSINHKTLVDNHENLKDLVVYQNYIHSYNKQMDVINSLEDDIKKLNEQLKTAKSIRKITTMNTFRELLSLDELPTDIKERIEEKLDETYEPFNPFRKY